MRLWCRRRKREKTLQLLGSPIEGSAFDERYKKGSFDVILVSHVLHLLEDVHITLHRMNELLKPGRLLISATACVGEKIFLIIWLLFPDRFGLVPSLISAKNLPWRFSTSLLCLFSGTAIGRLSTEWDYSPFKKIILDQHFE